MPYLLFSNNVGVIQDNFFASNTLCMRTYTACLKKVSHILLSAMITGSVAPNQHS